MNFSFRQLQQLVELSRYGNFARAAKALNISQPALSLAVRQLEKSLGARLVDRTATGATLTVFGDLVVRDGQQLIKQMEELQHRLELLQDVQEGTLSVVAGVYAAEMSGYKALGSLSHKYPTLRTRLAVTEWGVVKPLIQREADVALAELSFAEHDDRLVAEPVASHPVIFLVRPDHPLTKLESPSLAEMTQYPWALSAVPERVYLHYPAKEMPCGRIDDVQQRFLPTIQVSSLHAGFDVAARSDAVTIVPRVLAASELQRGRLVTFPFSAPWLHLNYGFIYLRDRSLSPAALAYMKEVRALEQELASSAL